GLDQPTSVVAGDFDHDGLLDAAVTMGSTVGPAPPGVVGAGGSIAVLFGLGTGAFKPPVTYSVGNGPRGLRAADLDGNGALDLIAVDNGDGNVFVRLNAGDGTFASSA